MLFIMGSCFMCAVCIFDYMVIMVTSREWSCVLDFHFFLYILLYINLSLFFFSFTVSMHYFCYLNSLI